MENDYSSFLEMNDDGSVKSFDSEKMTSYIDSLVSKGVNAGVEKFKAQSAKEQELAKMTENEKIAQERKDFEQIKSDWETSMKARERDLVVREAKSRLSDNFSEAEINLLIKNVTEDEKESLKYIDSLVEERKKFIESERKALIEELQSKQPKSSSQSNADGEAKNQNPVKKTAQEIKNLYQ